MDEMEVESSEAHVDDDSDEIFQLDGDETKTLTSGRGQNDMNVRDVNSVFEWEISDFQDCYDADWLQDFSEDRQKRSGTLVDTDDITKPVDFFKIFFPDELFDRIADNTNLYAAQFFDDPTYEELPDASRFGKRISTSSDEIKHYVALQIAMGICSKPEIAHYWNKF